MHCNDEHQPNSSASQREHYKRYTTTRLACKDLLLQVQVLYHSLHHQVYVLEVIIGQGPLELAQNAIGCLQPTRSPAVKQGEAGVIIRPFNALRPAQDARSNLCSTSHSHQTFIEAR